MCPPLLVFLFCVDDAEVDFDVDIEVDVEDAVAADGDYEDWT